MTNVNEKKNFSSFSLSLILIDSFIDMNSISRKKSNEIFLIQFFCSIYYAYLINV